MNGDHGLIRSPSDLTTARLSGPAEAQLTGSTQSSPVVLVVDDDVVNCIWVTSVANQNGYRCIEANDGESGLRMAMEALPDVIVLDVHMPGLTGIEVSTRLRERSDTARIPTLIFSAKSDDKTRTAAFVSGALQFADKPISAEELSARLRNLVNLGQLMF